MEPTQTYILIAVVALLIIILFLTFIRKDKKRENLNPLTSISFILILAGIFFVDNRLVGYSLMGVGILLAIIDIVIKLRKRKNAKK